MADFVYDSTALPSGKADARPLSGPASQSVTAAEWNEVMQAIADLRDAVLTGDYHGLITNPGATVSGATGVKLRNNAGVLQVSQNAGAYRRPDGPEMFHVTDYGASTGAADNAAAFQAAVNAAGAVGGTVVIPFGTWNVLSEITLANKIRIIGAGQLNTVVRANAAMQSIFALSTGSIELEHLTLDANQLATNAALFISAAFSRCTAVRFYHAVRDGLRCSSGNNSNMAFVDCRWDANGTMFRTSGIGAIAENLAIDTVTPGTLSTTINSEFVTGVGTSFTTMGIRNGDILRVGVSPNIEFLMIASVTDDTNLVLADISKATQTRNTQPFAIGVGDGYHEDSDPDNNLNHITGGLVRGNAGAQLFFNGNYGPRVDHLQIDFVPSYGIITSDGTTKGFYSSSFEHIYFESVVGGCFFLSTAGGITLSNIFATDGDPRTDGLITTDPAPRFRYTNPSRVAGVWLGGSGTSDAIEEVGSAICRIAATKTINQDQFLVNGLFALSQDTSTVVAGTTIAPTRAHHRFDLAGNVTMTATPTIALTGHAIGDLLLLTNNSAFTLTLQDSGTLASSGLKLGAPAYDITPLQTALFVRQVDSHWHLIANSGIRAADATHPGMVTVDAQTIAGDKLFTGNTEIRGASKYLAFKDTGAGSSTFKITPVGDAWIFGTASTLFQVLSSGILDARFGFGTPGTDATGTPGAVTINQCNGRAAIAIGASSVVVTNSSVAANDTVLITALGRDATCVNLVVDAVAAGSFTVSGTANATAATSFMFTVVKDT